MKLKIIHTCLLVAALFAVNAAAMLFLPYSMAAVGAFITIGSALFVGIAVADVWKRR